MRFIYRTTVFLLLLFAVLGCSKAIAQNTGVVRYVEVLRAHPRMQKFDFSAKRFIDGKSANIPYSKVLQDSKKLRKELKRIKEAKIQATQDLQASLTKSTKEKKIAEKRYWETAKNLDNQLNALRTNIGINISEQEFQGRTYETSILPEVKRIISEVNSAIKKIAKANKCTLVLNETTPRAEDVSNDAWIEESYSTYVSTTDSKEQKDLIIKWINSANNINSKLSGSVNLLRPVISENKDLTPMIIKDLNNTQKIKRGR